MDFDVVVSYEYLHDVVNHLKAYSSFNELDCDDVYALFTILCHFLLLLFQFFDL